jgi:L-lactate dehydrogenase complex protein LldF
VRIDLHQQLFVMRRHLAERKLVSRSKVLGVKAAAVIFRRPWLYRAAGRVGRALLRITPRWLLYNRWNVWGRSRELPAPPRETFRELHAKRNTINVAGPLHGERLK